MRGSKSTDRALEARAKRLIHVVALTAVVCSAIWNFSPSVVTRVIAGESASPADIEWSEDRAGVARRADRVIVFLVDTLRSDHLSGYGYHRPTSPNLDALMEEGVRFDRAYASAPWTLPSVTSLFTSLYPTEHGVEDRGSMLSSDVTTLAAAFSAQGWYTAAFVTNIYASSVFGLEQGFREFHELSIEEGFSEGHQARADGVIDDVLDWIGAQPEDEPYFLYVHLFDPHWDYSAPAPYDGMFVDAEYDGPADGTWDYLRAFLPTEVRMSERDLQHVIGLYDAEIRYTDDQIARVFRELRNTGTWDDTLIALVSDHGEELQDHGSVHHIRTLHEEVLRVPLVVKPAGGRPASWRPVVTETVPTIDVAPTLLALSGLRVPSGFDGRSLVPLMKKPGAHRSAFACTRRHQRKLAALIRGREKVITERERPRRTVRVYDLAEDPRERSPQAASDDASVQDLIDALAHRLAQAGEAGQSSETVSLTPWQTERLRALGYLE